MTYDANGNPTVENANGSRTTYSYDNENRVTSILFSGGTRSTYTYDGDGKRRSAWEAGGTLTTMIWDGDDYLGQY
jgi:YD repeat-containing protein